jgi:RNA polymerase sigma factor (sigma-70 family)
MGRFNACNRQFVSWTNPMLRDSDVNPAFAAWRSSTGPEKELALEALIARLEKFATAICWQHLPDHKYEFPAIVNGIVWRAVKYADGFKGKSRFSTWFYRVALMECHQFLRDVRERCEAPLEEAPLQVEVPKIGINELLPKLRLRDRELFQLVAEGQSWKTIGQTLGISFGAAKGRWDRLKRRLRNAAV